MTGVNHKGRFTFVTWTSLHFMDPYIWVHFIRSLDVPNQERRGGEWILRTGETGAEDIPNSGTMAPPYGAPPLLSPQLCLQDSSTKLGAMLRNRKVSPMAVMPLEGWWVKGTKEKKGAINKNNVLLEKEFHSLFSLFKCWCICIHSRTWRLWLHLSQRDSSNRNCSSWVSPCVCVGY